jgi:phage/plasmid-like protein (TIGR03299 family)
MAHQFDSGLFVNSNLNKEWHGLGRVVATAPKTTLETMQLAGMDWTVEESPVITIGEGDQAPSLVDGWKVLRRSDNGATMHVCRDSWTPVQNREAFSWFDPIIADGDAEISAAVSLCEGKRIAITAKIKDGIADVVSGDPVEAYLLLYNSHDGTLSLGVKFTNTRVVCANTLAVALYGERGNFAGDMTWNGKSAKIKHTKTIHANLEAVRDALDIQRRSFRYTIDQYRAMSKVDLSAAAFDKYLGQVFEKQLIDGDKKKQVTEMRQYERLIQNFESGVGMDLKGTRGTLWGAYNAITEWTTHQRGNSADDIEAVRDRLNSLWFGSASQINETAHTVAMAMV